MYDVAIIGAGVTGCAVARELSKYELDIVVLEGENDVATGASRANSAIVHAGYDCEPGTMMAKLNVLGSEKMEALCNELDVPYRRIGSFVLAFSEDDKKILERLNDNAIKNGVREVSIISGDETRKIQPNINSEVVASLYAKTAAITCPYELNIALAENAVVNGVEVKIDYRVDKIEKVDNHFKVSAGDKEIEARFVVNAAGLYADDMSALVGAEKFTIQPRKGEYMLLDRRESKGMNTILFQTPSELGKGVLVSPTVDDNVFAGPTAVEIDDKTDTSTSEEGLAYLKKLAVRSVPSLNLRNVITQFSGIRAVMKEKHDFLVGESKLVSGFVQAAGICSPGLSASPAMGEEVVSHLVGAGLELKEKEDFNLIRKKSKRFREMTKEEREEAIAQNELYGRVICRCETVTEAEVVDAIHAPIPAKTIDAIKKRTRAGMGRCQGGFCLPRVMEILSRELGISIGEILKSSHGSNIIASGEEK